MNLLVGGRIQEVAVMNQLSSNLHFMMVGFFHILKQYDSIIDIEEFVYVDCFKSV